MKRLVTFGDSFTCGYGISDTHIHDDKFERNFALMNCWPRWVAEKLKIPFINMGECSTGNYDIGKKIKLYKDKLLPDDIIIIAFSYPYRNETSPIKDYQRIDKLLLNYERYYFNAFYPMFKKEYEEDYEHLNLLNFIDKDKSFIDCLVESEKINNTPLFQGNNFWKPTAQSPSGEAITLHPNLNGYKVISKYIFNKITKITEESE
jgi:hypothetical protein|tara:strand:- start:20 stop:634 length:615 start_codon:yes stop_codon:yes gene_type:complete